MLLRAPLKKLGKRVSYLSIYEGVLNSRKRGGSDPGPGVLIPRCVLVWPSSPRAHVLLSLIRSRFFGQIAPVRFPSALSVLVPFLLPFLLQSRWCLEYPINYI